jgi:ribosomal protein S12 methylthiotransferase
MVEKVKVVTLGCEKNVVDSEIMTGLIHQRGYTLVDEQDLATVIIVNTCGFIDSAKEESINTILDLAELKNTARLKALIVSGCLTQRYKQELMNEMPEIDGIVGTGDFDKITDIIEEALHGKKPVLVGNPVFNYEQILPRKVSTPRYTAFVKIAEGCDHACTFCSIPLMRGSFRSRSIESILTEVQQLASQGVKEISLIAQDSTNYGTDIYEQLMLPTLLNKISELEGIQWIRLHYAYPGLFTDELIDTFANNPKICKYLDMPLQHSEDHILKKMRRPGRQKDIRQLINTIRSKIPNIALRTSMIVGFPGETEEDFENLKKFILEMEFDRLGVFTYSQEEDTPAAKLPNQVPDHIKSFRQSTLMDIQREISKSVGGKRIGQEIEVLIERYDGRSDVYIGRSEYDAIEVDGEVFVANAQLPIGEFVKVRITHSFEYDFSGEVVLV